LTCSMNGYNIGSESCSRLVPSDASWKVARVMELPD
jgi:hypothetical protein